MHRSCNSIFVALFATLFYLAGTYTTSLYAQTVYEIDEAFFVGACDDILVDDGGQNGDHAANGMQQITICSNSPSADETHIRLTFTEYDINGTIQIYNSDFVDPDALIYEGDGNVPQAPGVEASASPPGGCLTVVFTPTGSAPGFSANIECVRACQRVRSTIASSSPEIMPVDTGYIDICLGETITLSGAGEYSEDGFIYDQDDATSTFEWNMEDGTTLTGTDIAHTYDQPGGYLVQLTITDVAGCKNSNLLSQRVRVAGVPRFPLQTDIPQSICANDTIQLTASTEVDPDDSTSVFSFAEEQFFSQPATVADSFYLPDGSGVEYSSFVEFASFPPGATVTSVNDILGFCVNMEHSYGGDLQIEMECPNGTSVIFTSFPNGLGGTAIGEPIDEDTPVPGIGYDYCWNQDGTETWTDAGDGIGFGESLPAGDYLPEDDFSNFLGCPLNGEWTLRITDNLFIDNGFVFSWSIGLAAYLFPEREAFSVPVVSGQWIEDENMEFYAPDSISSIPRFAGESAFVFEVADTFGCTNDTTLIINVFPYSSPDCYQCETMLDSTSQSFMSCQDADNQTSLASATTIDTTVAWAAFPGEPFFFNTHPNQAEAFRSTIAVTDMKPDVITDAQTQILSVCLNVETRFTDEVSLLLQAPNGTIIELSTDNGITNDFTNTCFVPGAATSILSGTNPFTGDFEPEGNWDDFNGSDVNGNWTLIAWDRAGFNSPGRFLDWSIEFTHENPITYSWTPTEGLSCTDCPNPIISTDVATTYTVTATDSYGCTETGTVEYDVSPFNFDFTPEVTDVSCVGSIDGEIELTPNDMTAVTYEWSHGPSGPAVDNLEPGEYTVTIFDGGCQRSFDYTVEEPDAIAITLVGVDSVSCSGASDGTIDIDVSGGTGDFTYAWDDPDLQQVLEDAVSLMAGIYTVTATDENDCEQTFTALVEEPAPITIAFNPQDVACRDGDNGSAVAIGSGGNGNFTYSWETGSTTDTATGLTAGTFSVTATDAKGCEETNTVTISEPTTSVLLVTTQDEMGCAGAALNIATVNASGGAAPYDYLWENGEVTPTAMNLPAGMSTVTVTDDAGCEQTVEINLQDLDPITFNLIDNRPNCSGSSSGEMGFNQLMGGAATTNDQYSYLWSNGQTGVVATNLIGNTEYSLTITDQQGCTGQASRLLTDPAPITAATGAEPASCFGFLDGVVSISDIVTPNLGEVTIQWDPSAGSSNDATVNNLAAGIYSVTVTDAAGCTYSRDVTVEQPDQLRTALSSDDATCFGDTDGSIITTTDGGSPGYEYLWSNGAEQANISSLSAGNYTLTVTDANGCETIESRAITEPAAVVAAASSDPVICFGDATGRVLINGSGGREPFTYSVNNSGFSRGEEFIGLPAGEYTAYVRDAGGCMGTTQVTVADGPEFVVDLGEDQTIEFGDSIRLEPTYSGAVDSLSFFWRGSYDGTLLCRAGDTIRENTTIVNCETPNARPEYTLDYTLLMIDGNGCEAEDRVRISVEKFRVVEVPTGFTPNNDGNNDVLVVHGRPGTKVNFFRVFDRWGELIYEDVDFTVNEMTRGWNGKYRDQLVNSGVYLWQMQVEYEDGSTEVVSGETNLLR